MAGPGPVEPTSPKTPSHGSSGSAGSAGSAGAAGAGRRPDAGDRKAELKLPASAERKDSEAEASPAQVGLSITPHLC